MSIFAWLVVGLLAGWIANLIMSSEAAQVLFSYCLSLKSLAWPLNRLGQARVS